MTSDGFLGNASASDSGLRWQFRGRPALLAVLEDLFDGFHFPPTQQRYAARNADRFLFTGGSAGGWGALMVSIYIFYLLSIFFFMHVIYINNFNLY